MLHPCARAILLFSLSFNFSLCTAKASKIVLAKFSVLFLMMWSDLNQNMNTHSAWGANPGPLVWKSNSLSSSLLILLPLRVNRKPFQCLSRCLYPWFESPDIVVIFFIFLLLSITCKGCRIISDDIVRLQTTFHGSNPDHEIMMTP